MSSGGGVNVVIVGTGVGNPNRECVGVVVVFFD